MKVLDYIGDPNNSNWTIIQPVDEHDQDMLPQVTLFLHEFCQNCTFSIVPVQVEWFQDLSPWKAPSVFKGQPDFGDGAADTLETIKIIVSTLRGRMILGGYSPAGLFALWAGYQTDLFEGIAAASPSVWYPGWDEFIIRNKFQASIAYLSLGKQEEVTKNSVMRAVGDRIRIQHEILREQNIQTILEWIPGNHFKDADRRIAAGFAWIMNNSGVRK